MCFGIKRADCGGVNAGGEVACDLLVRGVMEATSFSGQDYFTVRGTWLKPGEGTGPVFDDRGRAVAFDVPPDVAERFEPGSVVRVTFGFGR